MHCARTKHGCGGTPSPSAVPGYIPERECPRTRKLRPGAMTDVPRDIEDAVLLEVFRDQENGFYVEIDEAAPGAAARAFCGRGWSGISVGSGCASGEFAAERPHGSGWPPAVCDQGEAARSRPCRHAAGTVAADPAPPAG